MNEINDTYAEPARTVPIIGGADVVIVGGGPAGCAAALAAARQGADVLLVEGQGYLGGAIATQLVCIVLSTNGVDLQGSWHDLMRALAERGGVDLDDVRDVGGQVLGIMDPEIVKHAWDALLTEAGVRLLHHAPCAGAIVEAGSIHGVVVETRGGRAALRAERVIDCTGDGHVGHCAGVPWEQGDGTHTYAMSCTKVFRLGNVHKPDNVGTPEFSHAIDDGFARAMQKGDYTTPVITTGRVLGYAKAWLWALPRHRTELALVTSRILKVDPLDPWDLTRAEREGRDQAWQVADFYRKCVPGCEESYLLDTSQHLGVRSSRRIRGIETVTAEDVIEFRKHPDGIARGSWNIDVWPAESYTAPAADRDSARYKDRAARLQAGEYYDIRYGALVAKGVDNLLVAGRCLSADHIAESSLRIQQTCMATGEAAGTAAALSLHEGVTPRELDPLKVVAQLEASRAAVTPAWTPHR